MGTTTWSPLASGLLTGKYNDHIPEDARLGLNEFSWLKQETLSEEKINKVRKLMPIAEKLNTSMANLALAWVIRNPRVTSAIIGVTKEYQLLENLKAIELYPLLTEEIMKEIDDILLNKPFEKSTL